MWGETHNKFELKNHKSANFVSRTFSFWTNIAYLMSVHVVFTAMLYDFFVKLSLAVKTIYFMQPVSYINQKGEGSIHNWQIF